MKEQSSTDILFNEARAMGLSPRWLNEYGLFTITINTQPVYLLGSIPPLNNRLACMISANKHATRQIVDELGLPNIPYIFSENVEDVLNFLKTHTRIIAKPIMGSRSRQAQFITTRERLIKLNFHKYIFEKYIEGTQLRHLILKDTVVAVHHKEYRGRISRPATTKHHSLPKDEWSKELCTTARLIAQALHLDFAAVDFIIDAQTKVGYILEVNAAPSIRWFQNPSTGPAVNVAHLLLENVIENS
jgi:glutathione synthase/RimK-type ligase-like ATP-grasp enzyme